MTAPQSVKTMSSATEQKHGQILIITGGLLWLLCLGVSVMSWRFSVHLPLAGRPVRAFLIMMSAAFVLHLLALRSAVMLSSAQRSTWWILLFAVGYRSVLLPSVPIQEIDIYRYMWDGAVVAAGGNPYQFSPRDVREAPAGQGQADLQRLLTLRDDNHSARLALQRIHYAHLTTIYPPVSQVVFATAAVLTPSSASIWTRLILTKLLIVLFDILAVLGLLQLLRLFDKADGWVVCYAWSPLVLKEFANSGHLDAIAVGITVWAVYWWLRAVQTHSWPLLLLSASVLGLGTGAKLYPVVIVPVVVVSVLRQFRWRAVLLSGGLFCGITVLTLAPMLTASPHTFESPRELSQAAKRLNGDVPALSLPAVPPLPAVIAAANGTSPAVSVVPLQDATANADVPPPEPDGRDPAFDDNTAADNSTIDAGPSAGSASSMPVGPATTVGPATKVGPATTGKPRRQTGAGLNMFLSSWKMNDFFFLIIQENLFVDSKAWFSVLPHKWKRAVTAPVRQRTGQSESEATFLIARVITAVIHVAIVLWLSRLAWSAPVSQLPRLIFLCVAWFWLLLPTLNPWYWIWAMPFLPFARQRAWLLLSGCVMVYYLRFYLRNDLGDQEILSSGYDGADFFHYVIVWLEYVPVLLLLAVEWWRSPTGDKSSQAPKVSAVVN